ncbi:MULTISPECIES: hypothetical protein [unclassified Nostoc]|uniref:hypothetical protein n=1 Tax=unclassified Nostoc TaxID=2593658 RepID=UPI0025F348AE|nr:hypothetical protein [Nostoc sp. JL33]MBN3869099.1 hypothetical protein [Nostoc sp. JL33]
MQVLIKRQKLGKFVACNQAKGNYAFRQSYSRVINAFSSIGGKGDRLYSQKEPQPI